LIINGERIFSENQYAREKPSNPSEIVGYGPINTKDDAVKAIEAASAALPDWSQVPVAERVKKMQKAIAKINDKAPHIIELLSREHGKPLYDAGGEVFVTTMWMQYTSSIAEEVLKETVEIHDNGQTIITHDPVGVVSAIFPWNYPLALSTIKIAPALLAGNTIVLKPSPYAPLAVSKVIELMTDEFPAGVINLVHGEAGVGVELTTHPQVGKVAFTGGTPPVATL